MRLPLSGGMEDKMDEIRIEQLEVYAYHGVYPKETKEGQTFYVNAILNQDTRRAGLSDELTLSTDYGAVAHFITEWMEEHTCKLIEAVAEQVAEAILLNFDLIYSVDLEIRKPDAPIELPFGSVSVRIRRGWHTVYLSVGSNLGDKEQHIRSGIEALKKTPVIRKVRVSDLFVTKPYGEVEQEDFLNGAIALETLLPPEELLNLLHGIEATQQRERLVHWGPRTLDLDIIFYDKLVYESDTLVIPHVDMQNRYFVLKPLAELAPNLRHPVCKRTVMELLKQVKRGGTAEGEV